MKSLSRTVVALLLMFGAGSVDAKTLRIAIPTFPNQGLNPLAVTNLPAGYTFAAIFDALTWVDNGGIARPQLADSWVAKDEHTWIFKLHPGVTFSNGEPLTADSIVFWIDLLESPEGAGFAVHSELGSLKARALDPLTLEVTTPIPNAFLPQELSMLRIMSPAHWKQVGGLDGIRTSAVGTGPFVVAQAESSRMLLKAWNSWRKPAVDELELVVSSDPTPRLDALLSRRVQIAVQLGPDDIGAVQAAGMKMMVQPEPAVIAIDFINTKPGPQQDVRVRRALNYAVNKDEIVKGILGGLAAVASQPAPAIVFGYDPDLKPYPYDPAMAKKLLAEAGYPNGFKMIAETYTGNASYTALVMQQVVADLAKVGVAVEGRAIAAPKYAKGIYSGEWNGTAIAIDYNSAPSLDALRAFRRHSCLWKTPWYCDEALMPLLNEALATFDLEKRRTLTREVLKRQRDQASAIFLHELSRFDAVAPNVKGFQITAGYIPYATIDVTE